MKNFSYSSVLCVSLLSMSFGAFSAEGLNVELVKIKINKEVKSLNKEILTLKAEDFGDGRSRVPWLSFMSAPAAGQ